MLATAARLRSCVAAAAASLRAPCFGGGPALVAIRGIAKYTRKGIWARGEDGQYTMDDPRIFRHGVERKYPYHKMRRWSKPYMCLRSSAAAPVGLAVKLAISYREFTGAAAYYELRRALEAAIPGAQILGNAVDEDNAGLKVTRVNDDIELMRFEAGREQDALLGPEFSQLVQAALDNFDFRYGPAPDALDR
eukprot:TRINITY_DN88566_c0_g1_i1.p1 TRINITY_DN88566_c0_g1~~TRINITY_DN88566_c0_g1_i1.p1  ORF type:complete len:192 (-),score=25.00 TRINITY_DN88566_c0_g1_i1:38-613(-)